MTLKRVDPQKALASMGVKFPEGSFIKYNSGNSTLLFHGTPRDLSMLEELVAARTAEQPLQVVVSATFLEVNQTDLEELGFNWIVNLNLDPTKWFMGGAGTDKMTITIPCWTVPPMWPGPSLPQEWWAGCVPATRFYGR